MRATALLASLLCAVPLLVQLPAETARVPLEEIRPGQRAVGITAFEGTDLQEFDVHILGVLTNVMGPERSIIVARLEGGPLAETGVIQGMSGSPVYLDDRLVGAVSYSLGSFSKDAIAGITPIDEMVATDTAAGMTSRQARVTDPGRGLPQAADELVRSVQSALGEMLPFARRPTDIRSAGLASADAARLGTLLQPIATPLVLNGFAPEIHELWRSALGSGGSFVTTVGGTMSAETAQATAGQPLRPGDPVGASLVRGDLTMAGTGTVTVVDGDRVYAFGHPFYNLGPARFPMTRAHVTTVLPSLAISSKIAAIGEVLGTFDQDRSTGIYGTLGPGPHLIPVSVTVRDTGRTIDESFSFEVIDHPVFTPVLAFTTVLNTLLTWTSEVGPRTIVLDGTARLAGQPDVAFGDIYTGEVAPFAASMALTRPLSTLLRNEFETVMVEGIDIDISSGDEPRTATLERVWVDASRPRAGDRVPVHVLLRNYRGAPIHETVVVEIPSHVSDALRVEVVDAATLNVQAAREGRTLDGADSVGQLIRNINQQRRSNRLYVRLLRPDAGAIVRGEPMPALPGSVLAVLRGNRGASSPGRLSQAPLGEWEVVTDHAVRGAQRLTLQLYP